MRMQAALLLRLKFMHMRSALPCTYSPPLPLSGRKVSIAAHPSENTPYLRVLTASYTYYSSSGFPSPFFLTPEECPEEISSSGPSSILRNVASPPFSAEDADVINERESGQRSNNRVKSLLFFREKLFFTRS